MENKKVYGVAVKKSETPKTVYGYAKPKNTNSEVLKQAYNFVNSGGNLATTLKRDANGDGKYDLIDTVKAKKAQSNYAEANQNNDDVQAKIKEYKVAIRTAQNFAGGNTEYTNALSILNEELDKISAHSTKLHGFRNTYESTELYKANSELSQGNDYSLLTQKDTYYSVFEKAINSVKNNEEKIYVYDQSLRALVNKGKTGETFTKSELEAFEKIISEAEVLGISSEHYHISLASGYLSVYDGSYDSKAKFLQLLKPIEKSQNENTQKFLSEIRDIIKQIDEERSKIPELAVVDEANFMERAAGAHHINDEDLEKENPSDAVKDWKLYLNGHDVENWSEKEINTLKYYIEKDRITSGVSYDEAPKIEYTEAKKYADLIEKIHTERWAKSIGREYRKAGTLKKIGMNIASVFSSLFSGFEFLGNLGHYFDTGEMEKSKLATYTSEVRKATADDVDWMIGDWDAFDFVYNTTMSGVDTLAASFIPGGHVLLAGSAAASATNDAIDRGMSDGKAILTGLAAGTFEGVFEKWSIDNLKSMKNVPIAGFKNACSNVAKSMGVNASEEAITEFANIMYDTIVNGEYSNWNLQVEQYKKEHPDATDSEAQNYVFGQMALQVVEAAGSGALMGFGFGSGGSIAYMHSSKVLSSKLKNSGNISSLIDLGKTFSKDTNSFKLASQISENASAKEISKLLRTVAFEMSVQNKSDIASELRSRGVDTKTATRAAGWFNSVVSGSNLKYFQAKAIESDQVLKTAFEDIVLRKSSVTQRIAKYVDILENLGAGKVFKNENGVSDSKRNLNAALSAVTGQKTPLQQGADGDIINNGGDSNEIHGTGTFEAYSRIKNKRIARTEGERNFKVHESTETFRQRISRYNDGSGQGKRLLLSSTGKEAYVLSEDNSSSIYKIVQKYRHKGMDITYCEGSILTNNNGTTEEHFLSFITPDGRIFISEYVGENVQQALDHEEVHYEARRNSTFYNAYRLAYEANIDINSTVYLQVVKGLNKEYNLFDENTYDNDESLRKQFVEKKFFRKVEFELLAFLRQCYNYDTKLAYEIYGGMFKDWDAVSAAIEKFNKETNQATSEDGAAFSMPENEVEGDYPTEGDTDPAQTAQDPQDGKEVLFDEEVPPGRIERQKRIVEVAKKLDGDLNVVWVNKSDLCGKNGLFIRETNTIYLAKDIKLPQMYVEVFKHEFVHRLESRVAYKSFKDYLINNSRLFEKYVRAQLKAKYGAEFKGSREEAIYKLSEIYRKDFTEGENSEKVKEEIKENFNHEMAQREIVADFVGEVLFKGKKNRADIAQFLADGDLMSVSEIESSIDFFEELAIDNRNLLQKAIDIIKDLISRVDLVSRNRTLREDLEYIEQRLMRVYQSRDSKKAADNAGKAQYSTEKSFEQQVDDVINGNHNPRYDIYVSQTPDIYVDLGFTESPLLMRNSKISTILNDHSEMTIEAIKKIPEAVQNPILVLKSKTHPKESVVAITDIQTDKGEVILPIWINQDGNYLDFETGEEYNGKTNFVASAYGRNIKNLLSYANENDGFLYQSNDIEKVRQLLARNGLQLPTPLKLSDSDIIVPSKEQSVNTNSTQESENYTEGIDIGNGQFSSGSPMQRARENRVDKYGFKQDNVSRANKLGELINEYYYALDKGEWNLFYKAIAKSGYLATANVGVVAPIVVNNKLIIAERKHTGKDAHDYVVIDVYELFAEDGDNYTLTLLQDALNRGDVDYDTQRIFSFVNRLNMLDGRNELLTRYDRGDSRFAVAFDNGKQKGSIGEIHGDSQERVNGKRVSFGDKSSVQRNNELLNIKNGQYSSGSPMQKARENLARYENGEISREEYLEGNDKLYGEAIEKYGAFEQGENAKSPISVPQKVADNEPTERFVRTVVETGRLTDDMVESIEAKILTGGFSYEVVSDEAATKKATIAIENGTAADRWQEVVNGRSINKNDIAIGEQLLAEAIEAGDTKLVLEVSAELADVFTRAGQAVQSARLLKKMTGAGRIVAAQRFVGTLNKDLRQKYGDDTPPIKISVEAAQRLANAKTQDGIENAYQEIMQELANQVPSTWLDKWNTWRYFAMLSNPKTHIRNIVGNAIFLPMVRIKNLISFGLETGADKFGIIDNSQRTKSFKIKSEYMEFARSDVKRDETQRLLKGNKYNDKSALREKQRVFKNETLEFVTSTNSNLLELEDMIFKNKHYVHALASYLQARKINLDNITDNELASAREYAVKEAKKATFNDENKLADEIARFSGKNAFGYLVVEGILPFKRTPLNIVKRGIEYSPLGLAKTLTKGLHDVKKGKITVTEYIDGLASGLTGTGIMAAGVFLASLGYISGGMGDDDESQFEKWLGKQEYAVEIFGKSYTIDWAAPSCIPFFIGVELVNSVKNDEDFEISKLGNVFWNSMEPIINLSMLSGIQSTIEATKYSESNQIIAAIAGDIITTYSTQALPALFGGIARTVDPTERTWYTDKNSKLFDSFVQSASNSVRSKVPGLTYTQAPKISPWGKEVKRGSVGERLAENFLSPGYYSELNYTEIDNELLRLGKATGENVYPKVAAKSFTLNGETKHLTQDEYVTFAKAKGQYSHDYITEFMSNSCYDKLSDEQRTEIIAKLYEYATAKAKITVSDYDLTKRYKTVTRLESDGISAVMYYIYNTITSDNYADTNGDNKVSKLEKRTAQETVGFDTDIARKIKQ